MHALSGPMSLHDVHDPKVGYQLRAVTPHLGQVKELLLEPTLDKQLHGDRLVIKELLAQELAELVCHDSTLRLPMATQTLQITQRSFLTSL